VVFVSGTGADSVLQLVNTTVNATVRTLLSPTASQRNFRFPVFSPDGQRIVFAYEDSSGSSTVGALGVVNPDGSGFRRLAGSATAHLSSPSFFSDGNEVLAAFGGSLGNDSQLVSVNVETGVITQGLVSNLGAEATSIADRVVLSPDNTQAVFSGRTGGTGARLFVVDLSTEEVTRITNHPGESTAVDSFPTWVSATQIAFSASVAGGDAIYVISATPSTPGAGTLTVPSGLQPWYGTRSAGTT
jgi:TolB protein